MRAIFLALILFATHLAAQSDTGESFFRGVDALPPDERFRQLSLMLLVSDGADTELVNTLTALLESGSDDAGADFNFDDYTTPLIRIVDQQTMLAGATQLFRFTRQHSAGIAQRLQALQESGMDAKGAFQGAVISEDAIIIRNAIADSIDYTLAPRTGDNAALLSGNYRARTTFLRNNMEYELFAADLERITQEAVEAVGGRTEAYERMFDDEVDTDAIDKKIRAAEYAYGWDRDFDKRAAKMAQEILDNIQEMEGTPDD